MAGNAFVGRGAYLAQILGRDPGRDQAGRLFVLAGIPGIGKTELLDELDRTARKEDKDNLVIRVNGRDYQTTGRRRDPSTLDEAAEFRQFKRLLQEAIPDYVEGATDAQNRAESRPGFGIGDWVMRWLTGIRGADVAVTHLHESYEQGLEWPAHAILLPLGNLDHPDVTRYLATHPGIGPDVAEIIGPVWDLTGGHPQALVLVADLIMESGRSGEAVQVILQLRELQGGPAAQLEALVQRIFRAIADAELRDAVYSLCVTRHFDKALLMRLLDVDRTHAQTLIDQIRQFSFVTESDVEHSFLAIDDFVRRIGEQFSARREEIHEVAADYYHGLLVKEMSAHESWWQAWYQYEKDRRFQNLYKDWLYHLSSLTGRRRRSGRLEIARIFLDGFWWWGCYAPFTFCEEILADWMSATSDDDDRKWGQALRAVYDHYPKGGRLAEAPRAQWVKVRRALRYLWDQGGFAEDRPQTRHARAILEIYLADALRFIDPADAHVDDLLDAAVRDLTGEDDFSIAWIDVTRTDLALRRGQTEQAMALARQAAQDNAAIDEPGLFADLHRIHADACWSRGEQALALDGYARAVALTYQGHVKGPDAYTIANQQEMVDRCLERMTALHADGGEEALAVLRSGCARIRAFFGPYWLETGADEVPDVAFEVIRALADGAPVAAASVLFPAGAPEVDTDLTRYGSEWELICHDVTAEMADELAPLAAGGRLTPPAGLSSGTCGPGVMTWGDHATRSGWPSP